MRWRRRFKHEVRRKFVLNHLFWYLVLMKFSGRRKSQACDANSTAWCLVRRHSYLPFATEKVLDIAMSSHLATPRKFYVKAPLLTVS